MRRKYGAAVRGRSGAASALREIVKEEVSDVKRRVDPVFSKMKKFVSGNNLLATEAARNLAEAEAKKTK